MAYDVNARIAALSGASSAPGPGAPDEGSGYDVAARIRQLGGGEAAPKVSTGGAFGHGLQQGLTLGFGDELLGVLGGASDALSGGKFAEGYRRERDTNRAYGSAAQEQHPVATVGGELLGGAATAFVPGLGASATLAGNVGKGAAIGAAQGLGSSNADLTRGDFAGAARDTAIGAGIGAATGAVTHGLTKLAEKAPERQIDRFLGEAGDGSTIKMRDKIAQAGDRIGRFVEENPGEAKAIMKVAKDPEKLTAKLADALDTRAEALDKLYKTADKTTGGITVGKVGEVLEGLRAKLANDPHEAGERLAALNKLAKNVELSWGDNPAATVASQDVRRLISDLQKTAFSKSITAAERPGQEAAREAAGALKDTLTEHVRTWAPHRVADLEKLNSEVTSLARLQAAAEYRSLRAPTWPKNRLALIVDKAAEHGALAASLATHNPLPYIAKKFAIPAAQKGLQTADSAYASLVKAAMKGAKPAQIIRQAAEVGLPRAVADKVIASFASGDIAR